jgi:hypothetical protein
VVEFQDNGSPNARPAFMHVPEMPAYVQNDVDRIARASMMDISGQHEVSAGQVPAGVTAASAINLLQEADDTRLGPDIADMEETLANAGKRILDLIDRYYDEERHIRVAGPDGAWDVAAFKDNMLKGCAEIQVQAGSGMPQSKAAKQAAIAQILTMFVQNGVPIGEKQLRKVLSEYPHVDGHTDFQKTARYQQLPEPTKMVFSEHVKAHRTRMLAAAAPVPGPPPPGAIPGSPPPGGPMAGGATMPVTSTSTVPSVPSTST